MFFILLFSLMMLLAIITENTTLNILSIYLLTFSGIWYFFFSFRHPEFAQGAIKEAKIIRYKNSVLKGIDADIVLERLDDILKEERIYLDEELTLLKLSKLLMLTPHQLSKILSSKKEMNFRTLINSYRIQESMHLMSIFPEKTILQIALESGFNSKSSFNSVFMKFSGMTPSDYRKTLLNN